MKQLHLAVALFFTSLCSAQLFNDLDAVLAATTEDAQLLADAYIEPLGQSLTYSLNSGWASSAKTHKKFGFDLTFGALSPSVSDNAKTFKIADLGLQQLTSNSSEANTVFGGSVPTNFSYTLPGTTITQSISLPGGIEDELVMNSLPTPYIQAGLGLFFDTDVLVRYVPKIKNQGAEFGLMGIGIKHNLMQYLGLFDKLPLNVSAVASYSKMEVDYGLSSANSNQNIAYDVDAYFVQALASLDFPIISIVGGYGYGKGDASMQMLGNYNITLADGTTKTLTDPLKSQNTYTGTHAMLGLRANVLFLRIFANYTFQEFNTLNLGASISFR